MTVVNLCPFDGEEPKQIVAVSSSGLIYLSIECGRCGVRMSKSIEYKCEYELKDILRGFDELANQWNRRVK